MEDVSRDAYDYFLNTETGKVITISIDALKNAEATLYKTNDESMEKEIALEEYEMPDWVEEEIELAIKIFSEEKERHVRIPERKSQEAYSLMNGFTESIEEFHPYEELSTALKSSNAFARFKKALADFPEYRKKWFAFNANAMKKAITDWLEAIGIKPEQAYH